MSGARRFALALIYALLGLALLWLAIPRTVAAWAGLDAQPAIEKLQSGIFPSDSELRSGSAALRHAIAWAPSARRLTDLALLELEQASRLSPNSPERASLLENAEYDLIGGLNASPGNGFAWLRLALVREMRGAPPRLVAAAVAQSLDMAPNMRKLWLPRASMLLAYWRYLTPEELPSMREQLRTIWTNDQSLRLPLMREAEQLGQTLMLLSALGGDLSAIEEFEALQSGRAKPPLR